MGKTTRPDKIVPRNNSKTDPRKPRTWRSREFLDCVGMLGECVACGGFMTVAAHSNRAKFGKGRGIKASDAAAMCLCVQCHALLDQGPASRETKHHFEDRAIITTYHRLLARGMIYGDLCFSSADDDAMAGLCVSAMESGLVKLAEGWRKL